MKKYSKYLSFLLVIKITAQERPSSPLHSPTNFVPLEQKDCILVHSQESLLKSGGTGNEDKEVLKQVNGCLALRQRHKNLQTQMGTSNVLKDGIKISVGVGLAATGAAYAIKSTTRFPLSSTSLLTVGALAAATTGGIWWLTNENPEIARTMGRLEVRLNDALLEYEKSKKLIAELTEANNTLKDKVDQTTQVTGKILEQFPALKGITLDNIRLSNLVCAMTQEEEQMKQEIEKQGIIIGELMTHLDAEQRSSILETVAQKIGNEGVVLSQEAIRRMAALQEYNQSHSWLLRKRTVNKISTKWLEKHGYIDLIPLENEVFTD